MYAIGIIWNMGSDFFDEIIKKIKDMNDVKEIKKFDLKDKYNQFVLDCYQGDDEAFQDGYIYEKINNMRMTNSTEVMYFELEIKNPHFKTNTDTGIKQCIEIRNIKERIRNEYSKKITKYFFDNLIHITDNEEEYKNMINVIKKYIKYAKEIV